MLQTPDGQDRMLDDAYTACSWLNLIAMGRQRVDCCDCGNDRARSTLETQCD